ncbi:hypothetical protein KJS94_16385 [Flavihumibacter rivuli]|uniref:hypothetical protein n=1 Tax=Flavihumibacter rivuli TaxID=2838156 RepID=UPI001BDEE219|nr:hypothetical protein [Flavihumibacter rivuli]ULQ56229.1 hypothetical protein KJS94_16385 [Flavihumibacter rivuli]
MSLIMPGWIINVEEHSNGCFRSAATDSEGRLNEFKGPTAEEAMSNAGEYVFAVERRSFLTWNKFLYDFFILNLGEDRVLSRQYDDAVFGSWWLELPGLRLVYDGKDSILARQSLQAGQWMDEIVLNESAINFDSCLGLLVV